MRSRRLATAGVRAVMLFGVPAEKDDEATGAWEDDGIVQIALRALRPRFPELVLLTDVCLCEYMSHGHCGVVVDGEIHNDRSLELLARTALSHAEAGADIVAPSDMMDGRVAAIRESLDDARLRADADPRVLREVRLRVLRAVPRGGRLARRVRRPARLPDGSRQRPRGAARVRARPRGGRRRDHDQAGAAVPRRDPRGARAVRRCRSPRTTSRASTRWSRRRRRRGWLDERAAALESLTAIKRAGADLIVSYWTRDLPLGSDATRRDALPARARADPRRRQLAGPRDARRRPRRAALRAQRARARTSRRESGRFLDWVMSWGPLVFGHADAERSKPCGEAALRGTSYGAATEAEVELAAEIAAAVPSIEKVRLVSSGTEAAMSALRLARAFTAPRPDPQDGRRLSRPRRRAARERGLRSRDARVSRPRPACRPAPRPTRSSSRTTTSTRARRRSSHTAKGSLR